MPDTLDAGGGSGAVLETSVSKQDEPVKDNITHKIQINIIFLFIII
ncbi:MAG: hypothetical protein K8I03_06570 [Ignavibacteria bacterium]|nr:hypothetical protein [Ignavibacteria bacterium]